MNVLAVLVMVRETARRLDDAIVLEMLTAMEADEQFQMRLEGVVLHESMEGAAGYLGALARSHEAAVAVAQALAGEPLQTDEQTAKIGRNPSFLCVAAFRKAWCELDEDDRQTVFAALTDVNFNDEREAVRREADYCRGCLTRQREMEKELAEGTYHEEDE